MSVLFISVNIKYAFELDSGMNNLTKIISDQSSQFPVTKKKNIPY